MNRPLYESAGNILGFCLFILSFVNDFIKDEAIVPFMYCIWYGVLRFLVEGLRTDSLMIGAFRVSQLVSLAIVLFGIFGLSGLYIKPFTGIISR